MKFFLSTVLLLPVFFCFAQTSFYGSTNGIVNQSVQLSNGDFVTVGTYTYELSRLYNELIVTRFSAQGQYLSGVSLGNLSQCYGYSITKTNDKGFIIAGRYNDLVLVKFDSTASLQWQRTYDYFGYPGDRVTNAKLLQLQDNGFMVATTVYNSFGTDGGVFLRTDSSGNVVSIKKYFNRPDNNVNQPAASVIDIARIKDGFICLAKTSYYHDNYPLPVDTSWLVKLNTSGEVVWSKYINMSALQVERYSASSLAVSGEEASYVITGTFDKKYYQSPADSFYLSQSFITKTDSAGNVLWSKANDPVRGDAVSLRRIKTSATGGGYVCAGSLGTAGITGQPAGYIYLLKIAEDGSVQWTTTTQPLVDVSDFLPAQDEGYLVSGGLVTSVGGSGYVPTWRTYKFDSQRQICTGTNSYGSLVTIPVTTVAATVSVADFSDNKTSSLVSLPFTNGSGLTIICSSGTLPVQLLSFTAALQSNGKVAVEWRTANEVNTGYFVVERSRGGADPFAGLQRVQASGKSAGTYGITDNDPLPGLSYYRLRLVDKDGRITFSSVVPVTARNRNNVRIVPNPVANVVNVQLQSEASGKASLQITDASGKILLTQSVSIVPGLNKLAVPATSLAKGGYFLKIVQSGYETRTIQFMKL